MAQSPKQGEWHRLSEEERNCLMWPDFLTWNDPKDVSLRRENQTDSLGLVTITGQDAERKVFYTITKRIKENHPASGKVCPNDWIVAVDGQPTTDGKEDFTTHIENAKERVKLTIRQPADPFHTVKEWGNETTVTLDLKEKKCGFELVHFYSQEENGNIKDRILVWEVNAEEEASQQLYRGDELLQVNDKPVKKTLAETFKMIFLQIPGKVKLTIRQINRCNYKDKSPKLVDVQPEVEQPLNSPDVSLENIQESTNASHFVEETDHSAGREMKTRDEVFQNNLVPEKSSESLSYASQETSNDKTELTNINPTQESAKTGFSHSPTRKFGRRNSSSREKKTPPPLKCETVNDGYQASPLITRKSPTTSKMCHKCTLHSVKQQPENRDLWPVDKMEESCHAKLCQVLDIHYPTTESVLSKLGCFSQIDAKSIKQRCEKDGGIGIAEIALGSWGRRPGNDVGKLKKIFSDRRDVLDVFESWEEMNVCHGCGVKLTDQ